MTIAYKCGENVICLGCAAVFQPDQYPPITTMDAANMAPVQLRCSSCGTVLDQWSRGIDA